MARREIKYGRFPNDRFGSGVNSVNKDLNDNFKELYEGVVPMLTAVGQDDYVVDYDNADYTEYREGDRFLIKFLESNTGPATINIGGVGKVALTKNFGTPLSEGDIQSGHILFCLATLSVNTGDSVVEITVQGVGGMDLIDSDDL